MTCQLDTWHDADLTWKTGNGHGARICGDNRWNLSGNGHGARIRGDDRCNLSIVYPLRRRGGIDGLRRFPRGHRGVGGLRSHAVVSVVRFLCPPSSGLALFGARPLLIGRFQISSRK
jgi:hypothetical protein